MALVALGMLILAGNVVPFVITYAMDLPGTLSSNDRSVLMDYLKYYYFQTYTRFGPYVIGMLFGWLIYNLRKKEVIKSMEKTKRYWVSALIYGNFIYTNNIIKIVACFHNLDNSSGWTWCLSLWWC